jgi:alkylation response protein AidB-like acyl-CoA dehydrogenase
MEFRLDEEQLLLQDTLRRFGAARFPVERIAQREHRRVDRGAGRELAELGVLGLAGAAREAARRYAQSREQYGVPIGSFQALQHLLADMYVRTELARSAIYAAARVLDDPEIGDPLRASDAAKLLSGEATLA